MLENTVDWIRGHRIHTRMIFVGILVVLDLNAVSCSRSVALTPKQFNFGLNKHSAEPLGYVVDAFISDETDHSLAVLTWNDSASTSHERMTTILSLDKQVEGDLTHYYLTSGILIKTKGDKTAISISPLQPNSFYGYSDSNKKLLAYNGFIDRPYSDPEYYKSQMRFEVVPEFNHGRVKQIFSESLPLIEKQPSAKQLLCCIRSSTEVNTTNKFVQPSQVICNPRLKASPLSSMQLKTLSCFLEQRGFSVSDVWFVRVLENRDGNSFSNIFFSPESTVGRIRKGKATGWDSSLSRFLFLNLPGITPEEEKNRYLSDYIQILDKKAISTDRPEVPTHNTHLPFSPPKDFTDQEIVEIVDFIRSKPKVKEETLSSEDPVKSKKESEPSNETDKSQPWVNLELSKSFRSVWMDYDLNQPILSIERKDSIIEVRLGTQEGFVSGGGHILNIRKTDQGYELIGVSYWVS